mmetsp:Transcript_17158/g.43520  ORF Transcript_17158/g.43520 Transcript_17158/m.43520 type:complete len:140 (-) Transcript_17158:528-947(-)
MVLFTHVQEVSDCADVVHVVTKHAFVRQTGNPFQLPRDFCVARSWFKLADGTYILLTSPSNHPTCPEPGTLLHRGDMIGAIAIRPCAESVLGYDECLVVAISNMDMKSQLASSVVNRAARVALLSTLAGLREACATASS